MSESKNVDSWVSEHDPAIRQIAQTLRQLIRSTAPQLRETIKWGNPTYSGDENIMYLAATDSYVNLGFFNGASLSDPSGRIAGTGKRMRHVKVRALEDVDQAQFESWIREALALGE